MFISPKYRQFHLAENCAIDVSSSEFDELRAAPGGPALLGLLGPEPGACWEYKRGRPASVWTTYLTDATPGLVRRHTIDVFAALADPAELTFSSAPVSQYLFGVSSRGTETAIRQKEVFAPNLPLFGRGKTPFVGDYIDIAGSDFQANADGTWSFNTACSAVPVFQATWTSNEDVRPPADGDWATYTPVGKPGCDPARVGMRNQNIYSSPIRVKI